MRLLAIALVAVAAHHAAAQGAPQTRTTVIRVRASDTTNRPIARADLSVLTGMTTILTASTDDRGQRIIRIARDSRDYNLVVRSIGYERADRFFTATGNDTLEFDITMHRVVAKLATVEVSAEARGREHDYNIGADEIAKSARYIGDGNDIIDKLRPMMRTSRAPMLCNYASWAEPLPALANIWVNGKQVPIFKNYQTSAVTSTKGSMKTTSNAPDENSLAGDLRFGADSATMNKTVFEVLHSIKPEHVAEIHYNDCLDHSNADPDMHSALFIVLKPGIEYSFQRGSFVSPPPPKHLAEGAASAAKLLREIFPATAPDSAAPLAPYRQRVIGVFDAAKNVPLEAVAVISDSLGRQTFTTPSGAASLFFLPEGLNYVRVSKAGYRDTTFTVTISPTDTVPITVMLAATDTSRRSPRLRQRVSGQQRDR